MSAGTSSISLRHVRATPHKSDVDAPGGASTPLARAFYEKCSARARGVPLPDNLPEVTPEMLVISI